MTDKLKKEIESAMEERKTILEDLDKEKESYAKYLISKKKTLKTIWTIHMS